jgi:hypothetical protein
MGQISRGLQMSLPILVHVIPWINSAFRSVENDGLNLTDAVERQRLRGLMYSALSCFVYSDFIWCDSHRCWLASRFGGGRRRHLRHQRANSSPLMGGCLIPRRGFQLSRHLRRWFVLSILLINIADAHGRIALIQRQCAQGSPSHHMPRISVSGSLPQ